jgi:hypothetical protein
MMSDWYTDFEQDVIQKLKGHKRSAAPDGWYFFAPAFATGVITGQVIGREKDGRIRETNKIL